MNRHQKKEFVDRLDKATDEEAMELIKPYDICFISELVYVAWADKKLKAHAFLARFNPPPCPSPPFEELVETLVEDHGFTVAW